MQTALAPDGPRFFVLCSGTRPLHFSCRWLDSEPITGRALGQPPALGGSRFYMSGNGFVYSLSSDTGSSHSTGHRQKWALVNGQFEEVKQPYYYLGRENSVYRGLAGPLGGYDDEIQQKPVALTDAGGTQTVATLQPGDRVTLLLLDNQYECPAEDSVHGSPLCLAERYLLRTRDGRQGWLKVRDGEPDTPIIDGPGLRSASCQGSALFLSEALRSPLPPRREALPSELWDRSASVYLGLSAASGRSASRWQ